MKEAAAVPIGFTKQTETVLRGIKANELIKEFKTRNISTNELHELTKEDFVRLGASEDQAEHMIDTLNISKRKNANIEPEPDDRISNGLKILKLGEDQLSLIQAYTAYCKFRLREERINLFVEPDKAISASEILCIAADATLAEVNKAELSLKELEAVIVEPKCTLKYPYVLYCILICGICTATYKLLISRLRR